MTNQVSRFTNYLTMKSIFFFLLFVAFVSACQFNEDDAGFDGDAVTYMLTGSDPTVGKQWYRTARFENGVSAYFPCDSSNSLLIKNVANTLQLKDSIYFSYNLGDTCNGSSNFKRQAVWELIVVNIQPIDSIRFYFVDDTIKAAINEITPSKFNISYKVVKLDSIQVEVNDVFTFYLED